MEIHWNLFEISNNKPENVYFSIGIIYYWWIEYYLLFKSLNYIRSCSSAGFLFEIPYKYSQNYIKD